MPPNHKLGIIGHTNLRTLILIVAFIFSGQAISNEGEWHFVRLGKAASAWPEWHASYGKATVTISGNRIAISAFYKLDPKEGFNVEYFPDPSIIFDGTIDKNGKISITATSQNTDEGPVKLHGVYTKHISHEVWGSSKKLVTEEEIVFPYPENYVFYGFSIRYGIDEK